VSPLNWVFPHQARLRQQAQFYSLWRQFTFLHLGQDELESHTKVSPETLYYRQLLDWSGHWAVAILRDIANLPVVEVNEFKERRAGFSKQILHCNRWDGSALISFALPN
jgi:hypothetical protein